MCGCRRHRTPSPTPPASPRTCRSMSPPRCRSTSTSSTARACSTPCSPTRAGASAPATSGESRCCRCIRSGSYVGWSAATHRRASTLASAGRSTPIEECATKTDGR
uniref:Uncharacterized protein n=1 Tax=Oryza glumipatula TaxID=40148 RepID=A0A0E0BEA3_9ORYZ